jgi:O-antigen/teichoic acid export membrane protein
LKPFQPDGTSTRSPQARDFAGPQFVAPGRRSLGRRVTSLVQIGSVVILARLLTPSDFGIVTMVTTFSLLLRSFGLNGFTEFIMQREELTDSLASNLFWINLGIGTILTLAFAGSGRLLALFYHNSTWFK